jgi:hypothetical protein
MEFAVNQFCGFQARSPLILWIAAVRLLLRRAGMEKWSQTAATSCIRDDVVAATWSEEELAGPLGKKPLSQQPKRRE